MLNEFVTGILAVLLGYAYPAFECFKSMELTGVNVDHLRFWCQYWVIVAILTVFEKFFEVFVSWLPLYAETKLAFFIYLWHPKTQGTTWVYAAFLQPLVRQHEPEIEEKLMRFRSRAGELLAFYIKYFTDQGKSMFLELLQMVVSKPTGSSTITEPPRRPEPSAPPPPPTSSTRRRSDHQHPPTSAPRLYPDIDLPELNSDQLNPEVENALRSSRLNLPRFRQHRR